ncbi:MAG: hypothetical protein WA354_21690, partial [Terracidiphilus sp.]
CAKERCLMQNPANCRVFCICDTIPNGECPVLSLAAGASDGAAVKSRQELFLAGLDAVQIKLDEW